MHTRKGFELTYCTNIHAAEGWSQVFENLKYHAPELRSRLQPQGRFGLGLRLANDEAIQLLSGSNLEEFTRFLRSSGLYVALINGFPYGWFHERRLKDQVFAPDWHSEERVSYTLRLLEILRQLLPEDLDGGISTCPLSYKRWNKPGHPDWDLLVQNIIRVAAAIVASERDIHLDIEPEPDGLVETTHEFIEFFETLLHTGTPLLAKATQLTRTEAEQTLRRQIAFCFDLCHSTVEYEEPRAVVTMLRKAGVRIGRVQISSAVKIRTPAQSRAHEHLAALADPVYLHQTIGEHERYADWPEALERIGNAQSSEWRVHYHVPLFMESYGELGSTQIEVRNALGELHTSDVRHLEIETYTWSVLPSDLRLNLVDSIEREYRWVLAQL